MQIIKKETLEFSEKETDAISLVCHMCDGLMKEATDPQLQKLAEEILLKVSELWEWEE